MVLFIYHLKYLHFSCLKSLLRSRVLLNLTASHIRVYDWTQAQPRLTYSEALLLGFDKSIYWIAELFRTFWSKLEFVGREQWYLQSWYCSLHYHKSGALNKFTFRLLQHYQWVLMVHLSWLLIPLQNSQNLFVKSFSPHSKLNSTAAVNGYFTTWPVYIVLEAAHLYRTQIWHNWSWGS